VADLPAVHEQLRLLSVAVASKSGQDLIGPLLDVLPSCPPAALSWFVGNEHCLSVFLRTATSDHVALLIKLLQDSPNDAVVAKLLVSLSSTTAVVHFNAHVPLLTDLFASLPESGSTRPLLARLLVRLVAALRRDTVTAAAAKALLQLSAADLLQLTFSDGTSFSQFVTVLTELPNAGQDNFAETCISHVFLCK
jgi:hypothetical protein